MKYTLVSDIKGNIACSYASEVAWLPLMIGDIVIWDDEEHEVIKRKFRLSDDTLLIKIKPI